MNLAESYVKLVLAVGQHDADYVDAYYGPPEWRAEADLVIVALPEIERRAQELVAEVGDTSMLDPRRKACLLSQLRALIARVQMLRGTRLSFDQEARALYDVTPPVNTEQHFQDIVSRLDSALPVVVMTAWGSVDLAVEAVERVRGLDTDDQGNGRLTAVMESQGMLPFEQATKH